MKFSKMSTRVEASLVDRANEVIAWFGTSSDDQDKDRMRKEFCRFCWGCEFGMC